MNRQKRRAAKKQNKRTKHYNIHYDSSATIPFKTTINVNPNMSNEEIAKLYADAINDSMQMFFELIQTN